MKIFRKIFKHDQADKPNKTAKERLTLTLAHERTSNIEFIDELKKDILEVIKKHTQPSNVSFKTNSNKDINALEIEIKL